MENTNLDTGELKLHVHYLNATFVPTIITIILILVCLLIDNIGYKSEWLTAESFTQLIVVVGLIYCIIISVFALTILFNLFRTVRSSKVLRMLSWFTAPITFMTIVFVLEITNNSKLEESDRLSILYLAIIDFIFIVSLILTYRSFSRQLKTG